MNVDDCTALVLHEQILAYHYRDLADVCADDEYLKPLAAGFRQISDQHKAGAVMYRHMGQRIVNQRLMKQMKAKAIQTEALEDRQAKEVENVKRPNGIVFLVLFLLVMFLLAGGTVMVAQSSLSDSTVEPGVTLTPDSPGQVESPPDATLNPTQEVGVLRQILLAIGSYFAGVGTIVLAGPRILSSVRNDKALLTFGEYLYKSIPADRQQFITTVGAAAGDLSAIIDEVSDDQPVLTKA